MDWDKVKVFHAAAQSGSFTHAGESLGISQSAVSRQVSALEQSLGVALFHRHARGLILTEAGDQLYRTAQEILIKLQTVSSALADARDQPRGLLRVTTTVGLGSSWLTERIHDFIELYPEMNLQLILDDDELDLSMREADIAIRFRQPVQPDLIQRRLFTIHFHIYASPDYLARFGTPATMDELDSHRFVTFGDGGASYLRQLTWLEVAGRLPESARRPALKVNNILSIRRAVKNGVGLAILPDYLIDKDPDLVRLLTEADVPSYDTYLVYPSEMRNSARVRAFRDFLVAKADEWRF